MAGALRGATAVLLLASGCAVPMLPDLRLAGRARYDLEGGRHASLVFDVALVFALDRTVDDSAIVAEAEVGPEMALAAPCAVEALCRAEQGAVERALTRLGLQDVEDDR